MSETLDWFYIVYKQDMVHGEEEVVSIQRVVTFAGMEV